MDEEIEIQRSYMRAEEVEGMSFEFLTKTYMQTQK